MKTKRYHCWNERKMENALCNLLTRRLENSGGTVRTFKDAGVMTMNKGLVIRLPNGEEFQLTIVQSAGRFGS